MENINEMEYPRIILGLDISTHCIGISIIEDKGDGNIPTIIAITHKQPRIPKKIKGIEALCLRKFGFNEGFLYKSYLLNNEQDIRILKNIQIEKLQMLLLRNHLYQQIMLIPLLHF